MKRKRYSVEQIIAAVKQHEMGTPVPDIDPLQPLIAVCASKAYAPRTPSDPFL